MDKAFLAVGFLVLAYLLLNDRSVVIPTKLNNMFPSSLVYPHHPDFYNTEIPLKVPPTTKFVVYWAADGPARNAQIFPAKFAYNQYDNAGVAAVDMINNDSGVAILRLAMPQTYLVSDGAEQVVLPPHVHYRLLMVDGSLSDTKQLVLPSNREVQEKRQLIHSTQYAYLAD